MPLSACSKSAIRDESYSFIWQPKVLMKTFLFKIVLKASKNVILAHRADAR